MCELGTLCTSAGILNSWLLSKHRDIHTLSKLPTLFTLHPASPRFNSKFAVLKRTGLRREQRKYHPPLSVSSSLIV